jgi:hypothetical protein
MCSKAWHLSLGSSGDVDLDDAEVENNEETRGSLCLPPDVLVDELHMHG